MLLFTFIGALATTRYFGWNLMWAVFLPKFMRIKEDSIALGKKAKAKHDQLCGNPPPKGCICFFGCGNFSSWHHLERDVQPFQAYNASFGESKSEDLVRHLNLATEFFPRAVVFSGGSKDICAPGMTAQGVADCFQRFVELLWIRCKVPVVFVEITQTPLIKFLGKTQAVNDANRLCRKFVEQHPTLRYVKTPVFNDVDFCWDMHHLTDEGHEKLAQCILPILEDLELAIPAKQRQELFASSKHCPDLPMLLNNSYGSPFQVIKPV